MLTMDDEAIKNRYALWLDKVDKWRRNNELTTFEAYKFLKLIYGEEHGLESWRELRWAEFDTFIIMLRDDIKNKVEVSCIMCGVEDRRPKRDIACDGSGICHNCGGKMYPIGKVV
jgi:hypothetical protein